MEIIFRLYLKFNNVRREQVWGGGGGRGGGFCSLSMSLRQHVSGWGPRHGAHNAWGGREVTVRQPRRMKCCSMLCSSLAGKTGINNVRGGVI